MTFLMACETLGGKINVQKKVDNVRTRNIVARARNHCCHRNATMRSLCIIVELRAAVNNIKRLSVATEKQKLQNIP